MLALVLVVGLAVAAGSAVEGLLSVPSRYVHQADVWVVLVGVAIVIRRPAWNPVGQLFFASYLAASLTYLGFAADVTVATGLSARGALASAALAPRMLGSGVGDLFCIRDLRRGLPGRPFKALSDARP